MDLEFQESEIMFTDQDQATIDRSNDEDGQVHAHYDFRAIMMPIHNNSQAHSKYRRFGKRKKRMKSTPVDIPDNSYRTFKEEEEDYSTEMVPPHVIVGRRAAAKMASLVCLGYGMTLKGRYLSEVRNSILRMTGFLES